MRARIAAPVEVSQSLLGARHTESRGITGVVGHRALINRSGTRVAPAGEKSEKIVAVRLSHGLESVKLEMSRAFPSEARIKCPDFAVPVLFLDLSDSYFHATQKNGGFHSATTNSFERRVSKRSWTSATSILSSAAISTDV